MNRALNDLKALGIDMINEAGSGHPGIVLGAAPILYTLYRWQLNVSPNDEKWINRDRFIMSAGHGSALLYATLFMAGYDITIDDLKHFRRLSSNTPGHPEYGITPGVDMTTGPLGQGVSSAVGMAIAEKILAEKFKKIDTKKKLFDYYVYALVGDGDLMEGVSNEACSLAGTLKLNNLIVLYDSNNVCLDGNTSLVFKENVTGRFKSLGWDTFTCKNNVGDINKYINKAKKCDRPVLIEVKTKIGEGSILEGTNKVHGSPLSKEDIDQLKQKLQCFVEPFTYDEATRNLFQQDLYNRSNKKYNDWAQIYRDHKERIHEEFDFLFSEKTYNVDDISLPIPDRKESTRVTNGRFMQVLSSKVNNLIGGSADVASSTKTYLEELGDIASNNYMGKNLWFGVREHGMASILNGLALSKLKPYGSAFLTFADYLKPAMRLACLMNLPVTYIFSHDSINIGQDGPTHQPIEQLASLRSIPNMTVLRPADAKELIGCWDVILNSKTPVSLILSRMEVELNKDTNAKNVLMGGYVVRKETTNLYGIIIATGSEVNMALEIADLIFNQYRIDLRVVSMPSVELFLKTNAEYQNAVLPKGYKTFVIEAGTSFGWHRFTTDPYIISVNSFGASGTSSEVLKLMNFDFESIKTRIINLLK